MKKLRLRPASKQKPELSPAQSKKPAKKKLSPRKTTQLIQKTSTKTLKKSPRGSKSSRTTTNSVTAGVVRPNEELRRTQLDLQQARDRYVDLYDFASVGFLTLDKQGTIVEANLTASQVLGVERKALLGQKLEAFVAATDQPILRQHLRKVKQRPTLEISKVIRFEPNHAHYLLRLKSLYTDADSQHTYPLYRLAFIDITEQEQAKKLREEQEVWIGGVFDTAMDAIITMDEHLQVVLFNKGAEAMFCCPSSKAIGRSITQFIPQRFRTIHQAHVEQFMQSGDTIRSMSRLGSLVARRSNGEEFPVEASISQFDMAGQKRMTVILRDITVRRKMEEELKKEKQFISTILDTTAALVVILDPEWRIVRVNRMCANLTGRNIEDMRDKSFLDLAVVSGEDVQEVKDLLRSFKGRQFPNTFENAWLDRDRQLHWIRWSNTVIAGKNGKTEYIIATGIDITERKQAEQEVARLLKHNESILHSAWEGIYGLNRDGKVIFFNRSAEQLTGWNRGEVCGKVLHPLLHHTKPDGTPYSWENCPVYLSLTQGKTQSVDTEVLWRKDGTSFSVEYTSMPIYDDNKKVEGTVVTFRDISERQKSEEALRESEERFRAFMTYSPTVAFLKDAKGRYIYGNTAFQKFLNKVPLEFIGKTDRHLFPAREARSFQRCDQETLKTGKILELEETTKDREGQVRYWWTMKFPVPSETGQPLLGGVALDITGRKQVEEALQKREEELQRNQGYLQALGRKLITAQEDERRRISRELHDDMNQRLAVLALTIQSVQKGLGQATPIFQTFQKLYDEVSSLSDDVRRLAYQLHPSILDDLGLEVALKAFISDFSKWEGIPVSFVSTNVPFTVVTEIASCLYRVTQECLRNVARHAKATQVDVKLIGKDYGLTLSITDNGKGFTVEKILAGRHGLGLIGMQERVRAAQGTYNLRSAPGQGTEIAVWVPTREVERKKGKVKE